jgi:hypothetical protein
VVARQRYGVDGRVKRGHDGEGRGRRAESWQRGFCALVFRERANLSPFASNSLRS